MGISVVGQGRDAGALEGGWEFEDWAWCEKEAHGDPPSWCKVELVSSYIRPEG
jgi:hypothetical protein